VAAATAHSSPSDLPRPSAGEREDTPSKPSFCSQTKRGTDGIVELQARRRGLFLLCQSSFFSPLLLPLFLLFLLVLTSSSSTSHHLMVAAAGRATRSLFKQQCPVISPKVSNRTTMKFWEAIAS
jgi:hypothetical protein